MKKSVSIIGGGPSAMFLAAFLNPELFEVKIFEKNKALGRKFLVAGKGGFNLTHSEPIDALLQRYTPDSFLKEALLTFDNRQLCGWLKEIGIPTFIGSSKRVYPEKGIKPIEVLKAITHVLQTQNVAIQYQKKWTGWDKENNLVFNSNEVIHSDYHVFALGGGSWKVTGSNGHWLSFFLEKEIKAKDFIASNCAYRIEWPADFILKNAGKPFKNISISCGAKTQKGEVVLTRFGLEGNAIYALSPQIQEELDESNKAEIFIDLKPTLSVEELKNRLTASKEKNITHRLRQDLNLSKISIHLLKVTLSKEEFLSTKTLAKKIKGLPLEVTAAAPVDEAISTTGGIDLEAVSKYFELKKMKHTFCIGEMLDWNAPTGGYLLQACFSMGVFLARHLNRINQVSNGQ